MQKAGAAVAHLRSQNLGIYTKNVFVVFLSLSNSQCRLLLGIVVSR